MDKKGRLTRAEEWVVGASYRWTKGRYQEPDPVVYLGLTANGSMARFRNVKGEEELVPRRSLVSRFVPV